MPTERPSLLSQTSASEDKPECFNYRTWYFAFCENHHELPWWMRLAVRKDPKHLQHAYAFTQAGDNVLFVEPYMDRVDFTVKEAPACAERAAQEIADYGHVVVKHKYIPRINQVKSFWNWLPTCVTVVKVATGFASTARTPKQLLHDLIRSGAHVYLAKELSDGWIETEQAKAARPVEGATSSSA